MPKYLDFFTSFAAHPDTGQILMRTDERVISQSIRNLVLTNFGERPYENEIGSNIRSMLFDQFDAYTDDLLTDYVKQVLKQEPRAFLNNVIVKTNENNNSVAVTIEYVYSSSADPVRLSITLSRVR